jgi:adenylate kinase family enzyme
MPASIYHRNQLKCYVMTEINDLKTFIFIGRSGCGKGTQAKLFMEKFKEIRPDEPFYYLESGKRFRDFIDEDTYSSELSKEIMKNGKLQPEFLAVWAWSNLLVENLKKGEHLILDGTPRKLREAHILETAFDFYGIKDVYVIHIDITKEETKRRLTLRGRMDDQNSEDVDKRLEWFDVEVAPTIDFYVNSPRYKYLHINGEQEEKEIHQEILAKLNTTPIHE